MSYTTKEMIYGIVLGGVIGTLFGVNLFSTIVQNGSRKEEIIKMEQRFSKAVNNLASKAYTAGIQIGIKEGNRRATSNLISAVETLGNESKIGLFQQIEKTISDTNQVDNIASTRGFFTGIGYIQTIQKTLEENAENIASGKIKVEETSRYKCLQQYHKEKEVLHF